ALMPRVIEALMADGQRRLLQRIVDARLLAIGAREAELDKDPATARAIERAVDQVLADALARRATASLDENALRRFFSGHEALYRTGQRVHVRHIVVGSEAE